MSVATKPPSRRLSIRHLMQAVLLAAVAFFPIAGITRENSASAVPWIIGVDLVALPVVLMIWNNKIRHDKWRHLRNRLAIWAALLAGYAALVVWLLYSIGRI